MLYESNRGLYLMNRYGPLVGPLLMLISVIYFIATRYDSMLWDDEVVLTLAVIVILIVLCIVIYIQQKDKWRIVYIGRVKIVIRENGEEKEFTWLDVEYITLRRLSGNYALKLKGRNEIWFAPYGFINIFTGDDSEMGVIIKKMKRELGI